MTGWRKPMESWTKDFLTAGGGGMKTLVWAAGAGPHRRLCSWHLSQPCQWSPRQHSEFSDSKSWFSTLCVQSMEGA